MAGCYRVWVLAAAAVLWLGLGVGCVDQQAVPRLGVDTMAQCVDPACDHREPMSNREWGDIVMEMDEQLVRSMSPIRVMCPKCNNPKYTLVKGMTCPKCGELFVAPDVLYRARRSCGFSTPRPRGPIHCPACNVDVLEYWRANRGKPRP